MERRENLEFRAFREEQVQWEEMELMVHVEVKVVLVLLVQLGHQETEVIPEFLDPLGSMVLMALKEQMAQQGHLAEMEKRELG